MTNSATLVINMEEDTSQNFPAQAPSPKKNFVPLLLLTLFLLVTLPLAVLLVKQRQEIRKKAGESCIDDCQIYCGEKGLSAMANCVYESSVVNNCSDGVNLGVLSCCRVEGPGCGKSCCCRCYPPTQPTPIPTEKPTPPPDEKAPTPSPTKGPLPTEGLTPTATPSPMPTTVPSCEKIKIYDPSGKIIPKENLPGLKPGDKITIAVLGGGNFDKARIRVNAMNWLAENETDKKNANAEFYLEYIIPGGVTKFKIEAELHTADGGWL